MEEASSSLVKSIDNYVKSEMVRLNLTEKDLKNYKLEATIQPVKVNGKGKNTYISYSQRVVYKLVRV